MRRIRLCGLDEIPDPGARGFRVTCSSGALDIFVVRVDGHVRAYVNRCPHRGTPLDWEPDQFLDPETTEIVCATHGARFRPSDGACLVGPCRGRGLDPVPVETESDVLYYREGES
ncbi:MAG TPA: Rieske (2Fe-2S) protein [Chromatiales bacterium]|nr:Rieske (2Fe-2S) protein [Chromatiales bacterium]